MPSGRVKWFSMEKGYGFIEQGDGQDVYVHRDAVVGEQLPRGGEQCTYELRESRHGLRAANVMPGGMGPNSSRQRPRRKQSSSVDSLMGMRQGGGYTNESCTDRGKQRTPEHVV